MNLVAALNTCNGAPAVGRRLMANLLEAGASIDDMLKKAPGWLPRKDRYFWSAGTHSGRLPQTLRNLADQHERLGSAKLKLIFGALYPVGMLTLAGFLMPIMWQIDFEKGISGWDDWDMAGYLLNVAKIQVPLWGSIATIILLSTFQNPVLPFLASIFPGFRGHQRNQAAADFSYALAAFIDAGTPIDKAWAGAGMVTARANYRKAGSAMRDLIEDGATPSEHLKKFRCFNSDFQALYTTGEKTGKLDENLIVLGRQFQDKANRSMTFASIFYPAIMLGAIAIMMVISIVTMYAAYLEGVTSQFD